MLNVSDYINATMANMTGWTDCSQYCGQCMRAGMDSMTITHYIVMVGLILIFSSHYMTKEGRKEFMYDIGMIMIAVSSIFWLFGPMSI
jgi:hypothetical protein